MTKKVITRKDLASIIEQKTGCSARKADFAIIDIIQAIKDGLSEGNEVQLRGFGCFKLVDSKRKRGYDITKRREIAIPLMKRPKFKAYHKFVEQCNNKES